MKNFNKGRINRLSYFIGQLLWIGVAVLCTVFVSILFAGYQLVMTFTGIDAQQSMIPSSVFAQNSYQDVDSFRSEQPTYGFNSIGSAFSSIANLIFFLLLLGSIFLVPTVGALSLEIKRLHDIGQSGWIILLNLVPIVGLILWIVLFFIPSEKASNMWGAEPKEGIAPVKYLLGF